MLLHRLPTFRVQMSHFSHLSAPAASKSSPNGGVSPNLATRRWTSIRLPGPVASRSPGRAATRICNSLDGISDALVTFANAIPLDHRTPLRGRYNPDIRPLDWVPTKVGCVCGGGEKKHPRHSNPLHCKILVTPMIARFSVLLLW